MPFYFGLDLGQTSDPSAGVILDAQGEWPERSYDVRHIESYHLGTPYPSIVASVGALLARAPIAGECTLAIDHTSVGRPIFEMFLAEGRWPIGITITGGNAWSKDPNDAHQWHVAKILLVGIVQRFLQSGRLRIGARLPHAATLQKELRDFRVKITKAANETYEAREGQHDDLVLGLAIALFVAEHQGPPAAEVTPQAMEEIWRKAGLLRPPEPRLGMRWQGRNFASRPRWG